jgi:hypothetical protein
MAASDTITVRAENSTVRPAVARVRVTAARTSAPACCSSRKRRTMNSA